MDFFLPVLLVVIAIYVVRSREQASRIRLLASFLSRYRIEKLMEQLTHNYLRALDEKEPVRREQILELQRDAERELAGQVGKLAQDFERVPAIDARVSRISWPLPFATRLLPAQTFDMRAMLRVHATSIQACVDNDSGLSPKDRAFRMTAELFLFQHTCHWFCKSRAIASARLMARHQTRYDQLVAAVAPQTRRAYQQLASGQ